MKRMKPEVEEKAWELFLRQQKKGISFVNCVNLAMLQMGEADKVFSYDRFYDTYRVER